MEKASRFRWRPLGCVVVVSSYLFFACVKIVCFVSLYQFDLLLTSVTMQSSLRSMRPFARRQFSSYKDTDVVVAGFARTPLGKLGGALSGGK